MCLSINLQHSIAYRSFFCNIAACFLVTAHLFCRPIINAMTARTDAPGWEPRELVEPVREAPRRTTYRPVRLLEDGRAHIPAWQGSGDLAHLAHCTGMVELPAGRTVDTGTVRHLDWRTP